MSYGYVVDYTRQDGTHGWVQGGHETQEGVTALLDSSVAYYESIGYTIYQAITKEYCPVCEGAGQVPKGRSKFYRPMVQCKKCKGTGIVI